MSRNLWDFALTQKRKNKTKRFRYVRSGKQTLVCSRTVHSLNVTTHFAKKQNLRLIIYISFFNILLIGCSNPKRNLIVAENDYEINLTQLDSVRENLNGFWIPEDDVDGQEILWLDFTNGKNSTEWWEIPYTSEIERTQIIPMKSCQTYIGLIKIDGQIKLERVGLVFSDTTNIEYLSKNKFKIHGRTYLKHYGYDFLKFATE